MFYTGHKLHGGMYRNVDLCMPTEQQEVHMYMYFRQLLALPFLHIRITLKPQLQDLVKLHGQTVVQEPSVQGALLVRFSTNHPYHWFAS